MDRNEIKAGMKVICKEAHHENKELYWAIPEMDEAVGKPMTVVMVDRTGLVYCKFETTLKYDDGRWCFIPDWLELYEEGEQHEPNKP